MRYILLAILLFSNSLYAGDIATERTQVATSAIIGFIHNINQEIQEFSDQISKFEEQAASRFKPKAWLDVDAMDDLFEIYGHIEQVVQEGEALAHTAANTWNAPVLWSSQTVRFSLADRSPK